MYSRELRIKTEALRQGKQSIKALDAEIRDLQQEFEDDRTDYLDTIRKQVQQLLFHFLFFIIFVRLTHIP